MEELFAKGHRSLVYLINLKDKKFIKKVARKDIYKQGHIENEAKWLKILNKYKIGPKLIESGKDYLICEFIDGERILDYWAKKKNPKVILEVFNQLRLLDKLKVDKEEMHHPVKHIIVGKKVVMIDFERCHQSLKPKNISQFCQFLVSRKLLEVNKELLIDALKKYKKDYSDKNYEAILRLFCL